MILLIGSRGDACMNFLRRRLDDSSTPYLLLCQENLATLRLRLELDDICRSEVLSGDRRYRSSEFSSIYWRLTTEADPGLSATGLIESCTIGLRLYG